ncbi:adenosine deaminase Add [Cupriavidus necator N-1]|uniref:Adenosine deaminase Add n=2 Tax=Cupriavidus necator TaxID=106590 RepID=G0ERV4_CUPNN|nr:adenosine deaminase Add [Cupriavidus necator N-1]
MARCGQHRHTQLSFPIMDDHKRLDFIHALPKVELHVHLEGAIAPERLLMLGRRNGIALPYDTVAQVRAAHAFSNLDEFLGHFGAVCSVLNTSEDFADAVLDLGADARRQNIHYREVMFTLAQHQRRGIPLEAVVAGLQIGRQRCREQHGVEIAFIADIDRTMSAAEARAMVDSLATFSLSAGVVAVGMDGQEVGISPATHRDAFLRARELGFHTTAHLGWDEDPEAIWEALDALPLERIDHGLRAVEDPRLIDVLVQRQIPLTLCPLSSLAVEPGRYPDLAAHPLREMWRRGAAVTLNSDDPMMIGQDLLANYIDVARAYHLQRDDLVRLAGNGMRAAFVPEHLKREWLQQLDRYAAPS